MTTKRTTKKTAAAPRSSGPKMVRLFHPSLPSFEDVPEAKVPEWVEAGWKKSAPKETGLDVEALPPVGEHPGYASVPVLEDTSRTTRGTASASGGSAAGRATGSSGSSASTSSTASGSSAGSTT